VDSSRCVLIHCDPNVTINLARAVFAHLFGDRNTLFMSEFWRKIRVMSYHSVRSYSHSAPSGADLNA
jgi:hypothetical protein